MRAWNDRIVSIELIKTLGLRTLGILLVLAGAALLVPSLGATEKHPRTKESATMHVPLAPCASSTTRQDDCRRAARRPTI